MPREHRTTTARRIKRRIQELYASIRAQRVQYNIAIEAAGYERAGPSSLLDATQETGNISIIYFSCCYNSCS